MFGNFGPNLVWTNFAEGACCVQGICFQLMSLESCETVRGTFFGGNCSNTNCLEPIATGACCVASGCTINTEAACTELGGSWTESRSCDDCPTTCPADLNGDGTVDGQDLAAVLAAWGLPCDE